MDGSGASVFAAQAKPSRSIGIFLLLVLAGLLVPAMFDLVPARAQGGPDFCVYQRTQIGSDSRSITQATVIVCDQFSPLSAEWTPVARNLTLAAASAIRDAINGASMNGGTGTGGTVGRTGSGGTGGGGTGTGGAPNGGGTAAAQGTTGDRSGSSAAPNGPGDGARLVSPQCFAALQGLDKARADRDLSEQYLVQTKLELASAKAGGQNVDAKTAEVANAERDLKRAQDGFTAALTRASPCLATIMREPGSGSAANVPELPEPGSQGGGQGAGQAAGQAGSPQTGQGAGAGGGQAGGQQTGQGGGAGGAGTNGGGNDSDGNRVAAGSEGGNNGGTQAPQGIPDSGGDGSGGGSPPSPQQPGLPVGQTAAQACNDAQDLVYQKFLAERRANADLVEAEAEADKAELALSTAGPQAPNWLELSQNFQDSASAFRRANELVTEAERDYRAAQDAQKKVCAGQGNPAAGPGPGPDDPGGQGTGPGPGETAQQGSPRCPQGQGWLSCNYSTGSGSFCEKPNLAAATATGMCFGHQPCSCTFNGQPLIPGTASASPTPPPQKATPPVNTSNTSCSPVPVITVCGPFGNGIMCDSSLHGAGGGGAYCADGSISTGRGLCEAWMSSSDTQLCTDLRKPSAATCHPVSCQPSGNGTFNCQPNLCSSGQQRADIAEGSPLQPHQVPDVAIGSEAQHPQPPDVAEGSEPQHPQPPAPGPQASLPGPQPGPPPSPGPPPDGGGGGQPQVDIYNPPPLHPEPGPQPPQGSHPPFNSPPPAHPPGPLNNPPPPAQRGGAEPQPGPAPNPPPPNSGTSYGGTCNTVGGITTCTGSDGRTCTTTSGFCNPGEAQAKPPQAKQPPKPLPPPKVVALPKPQQPPPARSATPKPLPPPLIAEQPKPLPQRTALLPEKPLPPPAIVASPKIAPVPPAGRPAPPQPAKAEPPAIAPPPLPGIAARVTPSALQPACNKQPLRFHLTDGSATGEETSVGGGACTHTFQGKGNASLTSASIQQEPSNGTLSQTGQFTFKYQPNPGFRGMDGYTVHVCGEDPPHGSSCVQIHLQTRVE